MQLQDNLSPSGFGQLAPNLRQALQLLVSVWTTPRCEQYIKSGILLSFGIFLVTLLKVLYILPQSGQFYKKNWFSLTLYKIIDKSDSNQIIIVVLEHGKVLCPRIGIISSVQIYQSEIYKATHDDIWIRRSNIDFLLLGDIYNNFFITIRNSKYFQYV